MSVDLNSDNCHIELNTCVDPTCALNDITFLREKDGYFICLYVLFLVKYLNTSDNEA